MGGSAGKKFGETRGWGVTGWGIVYARVYTPVYVPLYMLYP